MRAKGAKLSEYLWHMCYDILNIYVLWNFEYLCAMVFWISLASVPQYFAFSCSNPGHTDLSKAEPDRGEIQLFCTSLTGSCKVSKIEMRRAWLQMLSKVEPCPLSPDTPREKVLEWFGSQLVDHPTQLICIWIFICQHTKKKDIAG